MRLVQRVETKYLVAGLWSCGDAKQEARQIVGLLGRNGDTAESLRELIAVPLHVEALLRTFAREHPESQPGIERMLAYRRQVGKEFERLLREGATKHPYCCVSRGPATENKGLALRQQAPRESRSVALQWRKTCFACASLIRPPFAVPVSSAPPGRPAKSKKNQSPSRRG